MKQIIDDCENLFSNVEGIKNSRFKSLDQYNIDVFPKINKEINSGSTFLDKINSLRGGGLCQSELKQQQEETVLQDLRNIFSQQDIFQDLKYNIILLQRLLENQKDQQETEQIKKVAQYLNSKGNIYNLSNQGKLTQTQIEIIETAIENLLSCVLKSPLQLSYNLLQFTQNLIQVLFSQFKIYNSYTMKNLYKFLDNLELINQKYQHEKGLDILFKYQLLLVKDAINYQQDGNAQVLAQCIFEQNKYQNQNEFIFKLFQDANSLLQDSNPKEYDKYYFFQQLKLTIIGIIVGQQNIDVKQIVDQLSKSYQLYIHNNQNWRVQLGFLQVLLELILQENQFNQLSSQLIYFQIQDNINIWQHYIKSKCQLTIKCYLAFNLTIIRNQQEQKKEKLYCIELIDLFLNCEQDENVRMILQDEKVRVIQENFQLPQEYYEVKSYRLSLKTYRQKLQEQFMINLQNQIHINFNFKISRKTNHHQENSEQQSDKSIYLFKEVAYFDAEQKEIYEVNDFLWRDSNNSDLLLIYGMAGSGKSTFLKKLQYFLMKHYEPSLNQKKWIPVLIRVASLKEFNQNILSQILNADGLLFNDEQMKSFTDDIQNGQLNIVILFDGFDEMGSQPYEMLILQIIKPFEQQLGKNVKIIITARKESLISLEQIEQNCKLLTEIEILKLDESLIEEYLKQYCKEVVRQKLQSIYGQQQHSGVQFDEFWVAYFLEEVKTLVEKNSSNQQYIFTEELFLPMFSKSEKILKKFQDQSQDQSEIQIDFQKIQSTSELMKKISNYQTKNLIYTPLTLELILQLLSDIDKKVHKKKLQEMFKNALQKLKIEQIKSIDQKEQAKSQDYREYVENMMVKLRERKCFDDFSFKKLSNTFSQVDIDLIEQAAEQTQFTQYQFYKLFVSSYYLKQKKQKQDLENLTFGEKLLSDLNKFQMLLAVQMIKHQSCELDKKEIENILAIYFYNKNLNNSHNFLLIKLSFLYRLENNCYKFVNQSILEYFVGKYILRLIKDFSKDFKEKSFERDIESSQFNQDEFNLSLDQFQGVLNIINPELQNQKDIKKILIKILMLSRNEKFIRAGSNSILLINFLGFELIDEDLRGIILNKTNLSGLNFFGSNLDQSVFKDVSINYCNFNNASLQRVQWTGIPWNNYVVFKNQNQEPVYRMEFSSDNQYFLSQDRQSVKLWNLQTEKIHKIIKYDLNVRNFILSSDSTKLLVDFKSFYQIYYINKNDIRLLTTIPQASFNVDTEEFLFTFYHREDKLFFNEAGEWHTYNLKNLIQSKQEWIKSAIFDKPTKFSCVKPNSDGKALIGYQDGEINIWNIRQMQLISKNDHQSAIRSLSEKIFNQQEFHQLGQNQKYTSLLISTSEEQVIVWLRSSNRYERVKALSSHKFNGQLPRFLNFSYFNKVDYLVFFKNEYIIFNDINKIFELKDDIIIKNAYCMAVQVWPYFDGYESPIQKHHLYIAKDNSIEVYENYPKIKAKIPLQSCQPLSMHFCSENYMISYNQDETIRFWYISNDSMTQPYIMDMNSFMTMDMNSFMMMNQFNQSYLIKGSIQGYVQNLKQSYKWIVKYQTIKIAVQQNKQQINIYNVQISRDRIEFNQGPEQRCSQDQTIGCFAFFGNGVKIFLGINNLIQIRDLQNNQTISLTEIHTQDIYQILFNQPETLLVSCSDDNSIVIWNAKDLNQNYCIKNQKCLDLVFESERVLIVQTQNSIIWYKIFQDLNVQVFRCFNSQESVANNLTQQMTIVELQMNQRENHYQDQNVNQKQLQCLAIKQGNDIILKHFQERDQTKVVTFNEQDKNIEFASKNFIVYTIKSANILEVADIDDRKVITTLKFCKFAITERIYKINNRSYLIIVVETINEIMVIMISNQKEQPFNKSECIQKQAKGIEGHLALSDSGHFLAFTNNQYISTYLITDELQLIQMPIFSIDFEITNIYILESCSILIRSYDFLYQYSLNPEKKTIYSENMENHNYNSIKLNHNEKLLAKISENYVNFLFLYNYQGQKNLIGKYFQTSLDYKNFVIYQDNQIKYYDWEKITVLYQFNYQNKLYNLRILKDPNQILAISFDNLQIISCKEKKTKNIQGTYYSNTQVSSNEQVATIENQIIHVSKTENNIKLYYPENFGFQARNPFFTQDGQYIVYQQDQNVIFQSLSNPSSKYKPDKLQGLNPISLLSESNYFVTKKECPIFIQNVFQYKPEYYLDVWDVTVLSNVKNLFQIPILKHQTKKMIYQQSFISQIDGNVLCIYDIKELQKDAYDKNLYHYIKDVDYAGLFSKETQFYSVSKLNNSISIWSMETKQLKKEFKDHLRNILYISFSQDDKYMISRDSETIIIRNMQNYEKLIIQHHTETYYKKNVFILYKCDFVTLDNSLGITCQEQGTLCIYDLKDFKSYEVIARVNVNQQFPETFRHYVFSNGTRIGLSSKFNQLNGTKILIFDVRTKQIINTVDITTEQIFVPQLHSDEFFVKYLDKRYNVFDIYSSHSYIYSKDDNLLQIYDNQDFLKEDAKPMYEVFIHLNQNTNEDEQPLIQLNYVGRKYLMYYFNEQLRVIDLELYSKSVKLIKLDKSEKFLKYFSKDQVLFQNTSDNDTTWNSYNLRDGSKKKLFNKELNQFIVAFSNNGVYLAQGWKDGDIRIYKISDERIDIVWQTYKPIKHLIYTKDDKILISGSEDNLLQFWDVQDKKKEKLILNIQIAYDILSIVVSPNELDLALELQGGLLQILTYNSSNNNFQNQNVKGIGCFKTYPQLQQLMTENCILGNSIIEDQQKKSLIHHFNGIGKQEYESVTVVENQI